MSKEYMTLDTEEWNTECMKYHGRILAGKFAHWCNDWDSLIVDETTEEFRQHCCSCFTKCKLCNLAATNHTEVGDAPGCAYEAIVTATRGEFTATGGNVMAALENLEREIAEWRKKEREV